MRQRMFDGKTWYPHPLLSLNFFQTRNFRNTKWFRDEVFRHRETKKNDGKTWWPSIMHENFPNPKFLENHKGSPTMFFGTVRMKIFDWKSSYPPLLSMKFFHDRNFLRLKEVPHKDFHYCDTENFRKKKIVITPNSSYNFSGPQSFQIKKGLPHDVFRLCEIENSDEKSWYLLLSIKIFGNPNFRKHRRVSPPLFWVLSD